MSESDTMSNKQDWRCATVQLMLSTIPSYDNRTIASTLKMQIWIATNNREVPRVMKTKFLAPVLVFGVVSKEGHIMPLHIFEVGMKVNTKVYLDVLKSLVIPWCNQVAGGRPWVWQQDSAPAHNSKETQAKPTKLDRLHDINANKTLREKPRWKLHTATHCFEQILGVTPNKTAAVWPLTSFLTNHLSKINKT